MLFDVILKRLDANCMTTNNFDMRFYHVGNELASVCDNITFDIS